MEIIVVAIIGGLAGAFVHSFLSKRQLPPNPAGGLNPSAPASPGVLRVSRLELVDENGNLRGSMFVGDDGPALALAGPDERPRIILATRDGDRYSSDLQVFDAEGNMQVRLGVLPDRIGMALIKNGTVRMALNTDDNGGALSFFEPKGRPRVEISTSGEHAGLTLYGRDELHRINMSIGGFMDLSQVEKGVLEAAARAATKEGTNDVEKRQAKVRDDFRRLNDSASLSFFDGTGKCRASLETKSEQTCLDIFDDNGDLRAALGSHSIEGSERGEALVCGHASLVLIPDGSSRWSAP